MRVNGAHFRLRHDLFANALGWLIIVTLALTAVRVAFAVTIQIAAAGFLLAIFCFAGYLVKRGFTGIPTALAL
jgi:hypothetical protein